MSIGGFSASIKKLGEKFVPTLHLFIEAKISQVALKGSHPDPPCDIWVLCSSIPSDIELDEPRPIVFTDPSTKHVVRDEEICLYDLSYEDFGRICQNPKMTRICSNLELVAQGIPATLAVKAFAETQAYDVCLYETCDY